MIDYLLLTFFCFVFLLIPLIVISHVRHKANRYFQPVEKIKQPKAPGRVVKPKRDIKYPFFIPFYEWHGFINGLMPEQRKYVLSGGREGTKPQKW